MCKKVGTMMCEFVTLLEPRKSFNHAKPTKIKFRHEPSEDHLETEACPLLTSSSFEWSHWLLVYFYFVRTHLSTWLVVCNKIKFVMSASCTAKLMAVHNAWSFKSATSCSLRMNRISAD